MIKWRYITGEGEALGWGLASDEFLMNQYSTWIASDCPEPTLHIYTLKSHCAVVGRFQNLEAEVDLQACKDLGIDVGRRVTGGGAVVVGRDQLMISLASSVDHPIVPAHPARILPKMAKGIIAGLAELGINAEYRPKNDIVVNGRKIAGSAICIEETGAFLYQASLLVDFDVDLMIRTLKTPAEKISDKGINSLDERLTTITRELGHPIDVHEAREAICRGFERAFKMSAAHNPFQPSEIEQVRKLEQMKYLSDGWIHQRQPGSEMIGQSIRKTPAGLVHVYVALSGDMLKSVLITGDFFSGNRAVNDIESALKWGRIDRESIARSIKVVMLSTGGSIQGLDSQDLADIVVSAVSNARTAEFPSDRVAQAG